MADTPFEVSPGQFPNLRLRGVVARVEGVDQPRPISGVRGSFRRTQMVEIDGERYKVRSRQEAQELYQKLKDEKDKKKTRKKKKKVVSKVRMVKRG